MALVLAGGSHGRRDKSRHAVRSGLEAAEVEELSVHRVLFVNPSQEHFLSSQQGWSLGIRDVGYYQPLGILYVATYLQNDQPDLTVRVIDAASPDMPYDELRRKVQEFRPDVVGISTYTLTLTDALLVARIVKEVCPDCHVCLGGHHIDNFGKETLASPYVDSVVVGEGEIKFAALVARIKRGEALDGLAGVFTKHTAEAFTADKKATGGFVDVAALPFPDRSLLGEHSYYNVLTIDRKMTTIIASRGCPYSCTFCPQAREPYRPRPAANLVDEMEWCVAQGFTDFFFAEDTFNINQKRVLEICDEIIGRDLKVSWCCKARVNGMAPNVLHKMQQAGCYLINFGVETGTDEGLRILQKGTTTAEIRQVFADCRAAGILTMAYFMIGQPFERTAQDIHRNVGFLLSLNPDFCNINSVNPIPFTPLFDEGVAKNILTYEPWYRFVTEGVPFAPRNWEEHFGKAELQRLRMLSLLRFYFRPRYIWREIRRTSNPAQFLYKMRIAASILAGVVTARRKPA